ASGRSYRGQLSMGGGSCQVPATARYKHVERKSGVNPEFQVMATPYRRPGRFIAACGLAALMAASSAWAGSENSSAESKPSGVQLAWFGFGKSDSAPKRGPSRKKQE